MDEGKEIKLFRPYALPSPSLPLRNSAAFFVRSSTSPERTSVSPVTESSDEKTHQIVPDAAASLLALRNSDDSASDSAFAKSFHPPSFHPWLSAAGLYPSMPPSFPTSSTSFVLPRLSIPSFAHLAPSYAAAPIPWQWQQPQHHHSHDVTNCTIGHACGFCVVGRRSMRMRAVAAAHPGSQRPFHCQACGKKFSQAANLNAHMRTHSGERPFKCPLCDRRFSQSSSVTTHMRTHTGERPYKCKVCSKAFADSSTLTKHFRIHSGEKPYKCVICELSFSQSGNLNRHMRTHGHFK